MNDQHLNQLLAQINQVKASENFTENTLVRLHETSRRPSRSRLRFTLAVTCLIFAFVLPMGILIFKHIDRTQAKTELEQLRQEHNRITHELMTLKNINNQSSLIYLGGIDSTDYVLDLRQLAKRNQPDKQTSWSQVRPAVY